MVAGSDDPKLAAARYLGHRTSGEAIDQGFFYILIAITLGVLVEISMSLHKRTLKDSKEDKKRFC